MGIFERAYVRVDLDRIRENMEAMKEKLTPGTKLVGVVKADAYGHGAVPVAKTIDPYVDGFAVATADEAKELRRCGIDKWILILGPVPESEYPILVDLDICPTIFDRRRAEILSKIAEAKHKKAKIHIAVDTGMSRIGLPPDRSGAETAVQIAALPGIEIAGMFTHFARADELDKGPAMEQLLRFCSFTDMVKEAGVPIPLCHCANSAGIAELREADMDAVRAGITIYGLYPSDEVDRSRLFIRPAMEFKSFLTYIKEIAPGTEVSYGGTFRAEKPMRIATVSVGYGDGYPRGLSGKGEVLLRGKRVPILGRICMDQLMIDVSGIPEAAEGDTVTLLGRDGGEEITMEELAERSGGFHYEIPCVIGRRVPRVYISGGKTVGSLTYNHGEYEGF